MKKKNKQEAKETFFERNYSILRAFIVSMIFSLLGYSHEAAKYGRSKHFKTLAEDLEDFIYTESPIYEIDTCNFVHSERFGKLYAANVLIAMNKYVDDIIYTLINKKKKGSKYPIDEVDDIFQILQNFVRSCLEREGYGEFLKWNHKIHKKFLVLRHEKIQGFKYAEYQILESIHENPTSRMNFMPIFRYGYMMISNQHLPKDLDDTLMKMMKEKEIKRAFTYLGGKLSEFQDEDFTILYRCYLRSNPAGIGMYENAPKISKTVCMVDFIKFIIDDKLVTEFVNRYLYP